MDEMLPKYIEISDRLLREAVESILKPDILRSHSVSEVLQMRDNRWLLVIKFDAHRHIDGYKEEKVSGTDR